MCVRVSVAGQSHGLLNVDAGRSERSVERTPERMEVCPA